MTDSATIPIATWPVRTTHMTSVTEPRNGFIRWYDPITGRWLSNDLIGISGGLNQYVFCANNPVNRRDPLGLQAEWFPTGPDVPNGAIFSYRFDPAPVNAAIADTVGKVWASPASGIQRVSPLNSE